MKKVYLILAAAVGMTITSCTNNEYIGDVANTIQQVNDGSIRFSGSTGRMTRADHVSADAASLLNNKFYVVAFNGDPATSMSQTFDNYLVEWTANTAGKTASNTSDWEYVGKTAPDWSGIHGNTQTIKYWDYSNDQYDFIAWSPGTATAVNSTPTAGQVQITAPTAGSYAPSYTLTGLRADLAKCYIADLVTAYKADMTPIQPKFQEEVKFSFRNLGCKVRVALYETIPGYSVKDVKFYVDASSTPIGSATLTNAYLFTSGTLPADKFFTEGTYTVSFPTKGSVNISANDYNKAHVAFAPTTSDTKEDFGGLDLVGPETGGHEYDDEIYLGRTLPTASYAGTPGDNYYKTMLPNESGTVLMLRVDYTLVPTDGANETITVHGAKAYVPAIYAQWRPNYAYTYVFKISDNTNGWTSLNTADPAGLFPITFDAIVVDADEFKQSTITTVATPSITTYQKGHNPAIDGSIIGIDEYDKDKGDIYIQVMNGSTLASNLNTGEISKLYTLSGLANPTEADVMDALNINIAPSGITGRNGLTLTEETTTFTNSVTEIPGVNDNIITVSEGTAAKFTPAAGTYAYVYDTQTYGGQKYTAQPAGFPTGYYTDAACTAAASSFSAGTVYYKMKGFIGSYVEMITEPSDWSTSDNVYYSDEACTTQITYSFYSLHVWSLSTEPADWNKTNNVYYTDGACTTQANDDFVAGTYYKKVKCYRKYDANNKIYGVKVIKVVE